MRFFLGGAEVEGASGLWSSWDSSDEGLECSGESLRMRFAMGSCSWVSSCLRRAAWLDSGSGWGS